MLSVAATIAIAAFGVGFVLAVSLFIVACLGASE